MVHGAAGDGKADAQGGDVARRDVGGRGAREFDVGGRDVPGLDVGGHDVRGRDVPLPEVRTPVSGGGSAVVVVDVTLASGDPVQTVRRVRATHPDVPILVVGPPTTRAVSEALQEAGASGYMANSVAGLRLSEGVHRLAAGEPVVVLDAPDHAAVGLTRRELQVMEAVSEGCTNRQAAARLGLAEDTVKTHLSRAMSKLGASDRTHAVAMLLRRGVLQ